MFQNDSIKNVLLTFDVEDWFQVENLKPWISFSSWDSRQLRVEVNTHLILDLLDSITLDHPTDPLMSPHTKPGELVDFAVPRATFFVLGWIAERLPGLIREIKTRGHEVASHGYDHILCGQCSSKELRQDLENSKKLLEDIIGGKIYGYRAPNFSVTEDSLKIVRDCGYQYDSSVNSFSLNGRYGRVNLENSLVKGLARKISMDFFELPISNFNKGKLCVPIGGGGYFRLMPLSLFLALVKKQLSTNGAHLLYLHPWELDPDQPRIKEAGNLSKFRHYYNLSRAHSKLGKFINNFLHSRFPTCKQYLQSVLGEEG
jgi:polysaccharide deacetylase family protein (PEP-CTERM system associated)